MLSFQVQVSRRGEILFHPAEGLSSRDEIIFHPAKRNFQKICENTKHIFSNFSSVSYTIKLLGIYFLHGRSGRIRISQPSGGYFIPRGFASRDEISPLGCEILILPSRPCRNYIFDMSLNKIFIILNIFYMFLNKIFIVLNRF